MITFYWIGEYGKVFLGYLLVMYLWPAVVFRKHLAGKSKTYRFSFCVTSQMVIINTLVLTLGLLHILNRWVFDLIFYGILIFSLIGKIDSAKAEKIRRLMAGSYGVKFFLRNTVKDWIKKKAGTLWNEFRSRRGEYLVLLCILVFGMAYFSHGAFQDFSYGNSDMYTHHSWVNGLIEGRIFSDGVYPEAMHCFVYSLYALLGIDVYSIMLLLPGIHILAFLLAAYCLMKEIFSWRYSSLFVLTLFLTLDLKCIDAIESMARFQWMLPQEFGLCTVFLCALYLIRYLKNSHSILRKGKETRFCWDENLLIFMLSLTASVAVHFYTTIMAAFLCVAFALFSIRKVFQKKHLIPLVSASLCGILIALLPMAGALALGTPFQHSIRWGVNVIKGEYAEVEEENAGEQEEEKRSEREEDGKLPEEGRTESEIVTLMKEKMEKAPATAMLAAGIPFRYSVAWTANLAGADTQGTANISGRTAGPIKSFFSTIYEKGFARVYGETRAKWVVILTGLAVGLWLISRTAPDEKLKQIGKEYLPMVLASLLFMAQYAAAYMGFTQLVDPPRLCSVAHLLVLMIMAIPLDAAFSVFSIVCRESILRLLSLLCPAVIYVLTIISGNFHGFLYSNLTRYNSAAAVTNSIVRSFPANTYTVVAPTDEMYQIVPEGYHEELLSFVENSSKADYRIPTEYVFLNVEKKPLQYGQIHFFKGPSFLAEEKYPPMYEDSSVYQGTGAWPYLEKYPDASGLSQCPQVIASDISEEKAMEELDYEEGYWNIYSNYRKRAVLESKAYECCKRLQQLYPFEIKVYYEDEDFVCYYFKQEMTSLYNLGIE